MGWVGGLGVIIKSNLNRVRLSCCWVGLGCDNKKILNLGYREIISSLPWILIVSN